MSASGSPSVAISQSSTATIVARIVGREHRVVEAVVAVHDRRRRRLRQPGAQPAGELVDRRELARLRPLPLLAPAPHLAFEVAVGMAEVGEPDRVVVDGVDLHEHVDQRFGAAPGVVGGESGHLRRRAQDLPVDLLHHVEGRVVDVGVVAERERRGHRHVGGRERREHLVLARHVVRGRQHVAERRPPQHPLVARRRRSST